jgi:hypothetical protein
MPLVLYRSTGPSKSRTPICDATCRPLTKRLNSLTLVLHYTWRLRGYRVSEFCDSSSSDSHKTKNSEVSNPNARTGTLLHVTLTSLRYWVSRDRDSSCSNSFAWENPECQIPTLWITDMCPVQDLRLWFLQEIIGRDSSL